MKNWTVVAAMLCLALHIAGGIEEVDVRVDDRHGRV